MLDRPEVSAADEPKTWRDAWFDRDLSWLEFNRRVLYQALDERTPLLERVKFLAIFTSNLDEFFMKRLALLRTRQRAEISQSIGAPATELHLQSLRQAVSEMYAQQGEAYDKTILPQLAENGIHLLQWEDLTEAQRSHAHEFFTRNVYPALTPLALDPGHPFPYMSNLSISLGFVLRVPDSEENLFARVKVPSILPQWIALEDEDKTKWHYLGLKDLIHHNAATLFPGMTIVDSTSFRITRN
ncbi:MAG: polyphosphate kinase 1, partial [Blastopirellula sp. JB062]